MSPEGTAAAEPPLTSALIAHSPEACLAPDDVVHELAGRLMLV
jgi:hypothetical protein